MLHEQKKSKEKVHVNQKLQQFRSFIKSNLKKQIKFSIASTQNTSPNLDEEQRVRPRKASNFIETQQIFKQKYDIQEKIGQGTSGIIYKCLHKPTKKYYALKTTKIDIQLQQQAREQFQLIFGLNHRNVIKYKAIYISRHLSQINLVMQLFPYETLENYKIKCEKDIKQIARQLLDTVIYLHKYNVCHRDIKPQNILYNPETKQLKIIDFNVARKTKQTIRNNNWDMMTPTGTPDYRAPQTYLGRFYSQKIDEWSVGATLYKLITGNVPFCSEDNKLKGNLRGLFRQRVWKNYSQKCQNLISKLLSLEENRFDAEQALKHIWFTSFSNKTQRSYNSHKSQQSLRGSRISHQPHQNLSCEKIQKLPDLKSLKEYSKSLSMNLNKEGTPSTLDDCQIQSSHYDSDDDGKDITHILNRSRGRSN